jgi:hypothetical protein
MANNTVGQNLRNHARFYPLFHFFAVPILAANAVWSVFGAFKRPNWSTVLAGLVGVALVALSWSVRRFALTVQDRIIRLEMRVRLRELLPADLLPRIPELTVSQLVALRFAGDRELPALTRRVLDERLQDRQAIKRLITDWQPDTQRA